ncbi:MAG: EAL domain-containing protein [Lachnospiraceae bacterium]|nr:EAL domain-containing protein [Lachnospiraceae bacterium]
MERRMSEKEFVDSFDRALEQGHIFVVYQPQINHSTGRMIGAEALMRWRDPEFGLQYPADFIPALERNDLIYRADLYVFEKVCIFQQKCLGSPVSPVPVSFNISRYDIFEKDYVDAIEEIRKKYRVPVRFLRAEITESSAIGGMEVISEVLRKLHEYGYMVEMDDFGSGYSSLNILKDLEVDVIKLDMDFFRGEVGGRGGVIISSMVQLTKWLHTPVIAEGVETMEQAEFMKSIGCNYIQGYLYSKPLEEGDFIRKLAQLEHEPEMNSMEMAESMHAEKFWNPDSMETLIFNDFVGAAAIFSYSDGQIDIQRVNKKYIKEIGMNLTAQDFVTMNPWTYVSAEGRRAYKSVIQKAIKTGEEQKVDTWRTFESRCCGEDKICIRSTIRLIGRAETQYLFYAMIQNVTAEKKRFIELFDSEKIFQHAFDQANVFAWEYIYATKQMHPCFRCMRELHLPPVVENYPDSLIEIGIFPSDYADEYRGWIKKLEEGAESIEGIIPLTVGRIPFHVRYTNEFDENGKPLKAYGSATLVVDGEKEG